jgi:hypothetical protein
MLAQDCGEFCAHDQFLVVVKFCATSRMLDDVGSRVKNFISRASNGVVQRVVLRSVLRCQDSALCDNVTGFWGGEGEKVKIHRTPIFA